LKDYPALSVAKERLALVEERLKQAEVQNAKLKEENSALIAECTELRKKVSAHEKTSPFIEYMGVLWKERGHLVEPLAYCPDCKLAMSAFPPSSDETLICSKCNFVAPFLPSQIRDMTLRLEVELLSA
ncbi:MAG: hypothetical protein ACRD2L_08605, partial [Terriglobia bacterium]